MGSWKTEVRLDTVEATPVYAAMVRLQTELSTPHLESGSLRSVVAIWFPPAVNINRLGFLEFSLREPLRRCVRLLIR